MPLHLWFLLLSLSSLTNNPLPNHRILFGEKRLSSKRGANVTRVRAREISRAEVMAFGRDTRVTFGVLDEIPEAGLAALLLADDWYMTRCPRLVLSPFVHFRPREKSPGLMFVRGIHSVPGPSVHMSERNVVRSVECQLLWSPSSCAWKIVIHIHF